MPFVPDSRQAGYLGPAPTPQEPVDDAWENFLHDLVAGVTGLPPDLVRPRWQPEPPNMPTFDTNWVAFGISEVFLDFEPWMGNDPHGNNGLGQVMLQEHEVDTVMCSFYGPNAGQYASFMRRGLYIWQNRAVLRANGCGLVEVTSLNRAPELYMNQWVNRIDTNIILRREIRYNYNVATIIGAQVSIEAEPPYSKRHIHRDVEVGSETLWDHYARGSFTYWDDGRTKWDVVE
jgi:hypothetical protein